MLNWMARQGQLVRTEATSTSEFRGLSTAHSSSARPASVRWPKSICFAEMPSGPTDAQRVCSFGSCVTPPTAQKPRRVSKGSQRPWLIARDGCCQRHKRARTTRSNRAVSQGETRSLPMQPQEASPVTALTVAAPRKAAKQPRATIRAHLVPSRKGARDQE